MIIFGSFQISTENAPSPEQPSATKKEMKELVAKDLDTASVDNCKQSSPKNNVAILDQTNLNDFTLNRAQTST